MLKQWKEAKRREGGFTLIELLIVVVILGILAAIVLFAVGGFTGTSAQAACKTDMKQVSTAISAYYAQNGTYPGAIQSTPAAPTDLVPTYMQQAPPSGVSTSNGSHYSITMTAGSPPTVSGMFDKSGTATPC